MSSHALGRKVHIYNTRDTNTVLGGLFATDDMTNANFYSMVEIVFIFDNDYTLCSESGTTGAVSRARCAPPLCEWGLAHRTR